MHRDKTLPLFDPNGIFWRVNREAVLLVGGGSALLLQIAHPLVAAGVAEHSGFREQPVRRLYRTVSAMQKIIYADRQTALDAASRVNRVHATVHGVLTEPTPVFPVGTPYRAKAGIYKLLDSLDSRLSGGPASRSDGLQRLFRGHQGTDLCIHVASGYCV